MTGTRGVTGRGGGGGGGGGGGRGKGRECHLFSGYVTILGVIVQWDFC